MADVTTDRRTWACAAGAGLLIMVALMALFRSPAPLPTAAAPVRPGTPGRPYVQLLPVGGVAGDALLAERVALFDPATLFLPTEWNSSHVVKQVSEPGSAFAGYPPEWAFGEGAPVLDLPQPAVPASPADALADDPPGTPLLGFGRTDLPDPALPLRGAQVEVTNTATGEVVLSRALAEAAPPSDAPWQPMEFLAAVDAGGLVGPLVVTVPSGARSVDAYFRRYLAEILRVGLRLTPGFYRISVGP